MYSSSVSYVRFGEDDASLLLEEKMWARMQKDRNQRSRSGGIFNLGDDSGPSEVLTHRGQALGTSNDEDGFGAQVDEDDDLDAEVVDQLHFGGHGDRDSRATHPQVRSSFDQRLLLCMYSACWYRALFLYSFNEHRSRYPADRPINDIILFCGAKITGIF